MKKTRATGSLMPFIQITRTGDQVAVMFDQAGLGAHASRIVFIRKESMRQLSWEICDVPSGASNEVNPQLETGGIQKGVATIYLLVTKDSGQDRHELGYVVSDAPEARQAIAAAFQAALVAYLQDERLAAGSSVVSMTAPATPGYPGVGYPASKRSFGKTFAVVTVPLLLLGAVSAGLVAWADGRVDPIQAAVAQNMTQDPASIMAQVELTKETLRQMGLDPGRGGDLGCLAPQQ